MKKLIAIVAITAAVLSMLVAGSSPASAHAEWYSHGDDYFYVTQYHYGVIVCDVQNEGNYSYIVVEFADGSHGSERDADEEYDPGCDIQYWNEPFYNVWVCEERGGDGGHDDHCKGPYRHS